MPRDQRRTASRVGGLMSKGAVTEQKKPDSILNLAVTFVLCCLGLVMLAPQLLYKNVA